MALTLDRMPGAFAEDSAHTDGDRGMFILAVANHTEGALHDTDGDYAALQVDNLGRLRTITDIDLGSSVADDSPDTENPIKMGSRSRFGAVLPAISATNDKADLISDEFRRLYVNNSPNVAMQNAAKSIDNVAEVLLNGGAGNLGGRTWMLVQNRGPKSIYVGATGVSTANGIEIDAKSNLDLKIGEYLNLYAIGSTAAADDVRVLEVA